MNDLGIAAACVATDTVFGLKDGNIVSAECELARCGEADNTGTNDNTIEGVAHSLAMLRFE